MSGRCPSSNSASKVEPITWAIRPVAVAVAMSGSSGIRSGDHPQMTQMNADETRKCSWNHLIVVICASAVKILVLLQSRGPADDLGKIAGDLRSVGRGCTAG